MAPAMLIVVAAAYYYDAAFLLFFLMPLTARAMFMLDATPCLSRYFRYLLPSLRHTTRMLY